ncbi:hypothetical protein [Actinoplanes awajinensis]|uniref:hypothetical protein n=1 Tax=Actinoplanes awajinensis TaxID=135946 RepID=UPI0012FAEBAB|nr:hypothetical protein [Actinoplanes awajinensis]
MVENEEVRVLDQVRSRSRKGGDGVRDLVQSGGIVVRRVLSEPVELIKRVGGLHGNVQ